MQIAISGRIQSALEISIAPLVFVILKAHKFSHVWPKRAFRRVSLKVLGGITRRYRWRVLVEENFATCLIYVYTPHINLAIAWVEFFIIVRPYAEKADSELKKVFCRVEWCIILIIHVLEDRVDNELGLCMIDELCASNKSKAAHCEYNQQA